MRTSHTRIPSDIQFRPQQRQRRSRGLEKGSSDPSIVESQLLSLTESGRVSPFRQLITTLAINGILVGTVSGLILALNDFGATWLFLPFWEERFLLLYRILGFFLPVGAFAGLILFMTVGTISSMCRGITWNLVKGNQSKSERTLKLLVPSFYTLLLSPLAIWLALRLFQGGKMSRLSYREPLEIFTAVVLLCGIWILFFSTQQLICFIKKGSGKTFFFFFLLLLCFVFIIGKCDQLILPTQYLYIHNLLSVICFCISALSLYILFISSRISILKSLPVTAILILPFLGIIFFFNLITLETNQNVRVALMDPRASHIRSFMLGIQPFLYSTTNIKTPLAATRIAKEARALRKNLKVSGTGADLPIFPNSHVLLISIDALRADHLGTYGYSRPVSPNIDNFAETSIVFTRAYTQAPHSSYSLSSIMTSEYLHETVELGQPLPAPTIATALRTAGYHTAAFYTLGIFHTEGLRLRLYEQNSYGFSLHDHTVRSAEATTDRVLEEIDRTVTRGEPNSLFWVHYFDVHEPYQATTFGTSDIDRYDSEIHKVDHAVGKLIEESRKRLQRNVIVIITADHGEEFREHGGVYHGSSLYDEQVRVPLIINLPNLPAARINTPVELIDITPTVLALLDVPKYQNMRGDDLRTIIAGKTHDLGPVFSGVIHKRMVVRWPYKLIADLRFGLFELYNISTDPQERYNLADKQHDLLESLRGEVYAWLDSFNEHKKYHQDTCIAAINRGRLGDRRAVVPLIEIISKEDKSIVLRREAARILGNLADPRAIPGLLTAMHSDNKLLAAEAAIAIGRMYDQRAHSALQKLIAAEDPDIRSRAAVSLARLHDKAAVPGLIDALWIAPNKYERQEAVRWLGRLRDSRALEPLINVLPESRIRYLVVIALGLVGDNRAFNPLSEVLTWERHANIRDNAIRGLGLLGDPRAVDIIVPIAVREDTLKNSSESLVRLNAIELKAIGGTDVSKGQLGLRGFRHCHVGPLLHDWNYLHRTWCETSSSKASLRLSVPDSVAHSLHGALAVLSIKRIDREQATKIIVSIGSKQLDPINVDGTWKEHRWYLDSEILSSKFTSAKISSNEQHARFALDHLLLMPLDSEIGSLHGG